MQNYNIRKSIKSANAVKLTSINIPEGNIRIQYTEINFDDRNAIH